MDKLTVSQAYFAMLHFLERFYQHTGSDDVAVLLGGMQMLPDGTTADPAAWTDWIDSVQHILRLEKVQDLYLKPEEHRNAASSDDN